MCYQQEAITNEGSCTTSNSASTINLAVLYDYLKQFYEKVSDDPGGKNLTFLCKLHPQYVLQYIVRDLQFQC